MSTSPGSLETSNRHRGFPIWPGVIVGLGVAVGLTIGLEVLRPLPHAIVRVLGGAMVLAHGIMAFAMVTLLGEALTIAGWDRALGEQLERYSQPNPGHSFLVDPRDLSAFLGQIEGTSREILQRWQERRQIGQLVTYIIPLVGFGVTAWDAGTQDSWADSGQPLLISLSEGFFVLLLIVGISHASEVVGDGWRLLAKMVRAGHTPGDFSPGPTASTEPPRV